MKRLLASLLLSTGVVSAQQTAGTTTLDPSQVYTTGNIVQPTVAGTGTTPWVNGVYQDQLTCWAWGNPGYCGPNAIVRPGNNINFSYGLTDLYQVQSIASVLPSTGLRVNGYNFGFMAKNGNGWDGGGQDYLTAYVAFYGTDNKVKDYTNYNLNSKFDWTAFNYTKDFVTPYADKDLSTVRYGFVGMDNNYWAGPYGPEIYNVSFSLKYSVDPCAVNILSSPTCPGYMDALAKLMPAPTIDPTTTSSTTTTPTSTITTTVTTDPVSPTVAVTSTPTATSSNSTSTTSTTATSSTSTTASATSSATPAKEGSQTSSGTSIGLSIIGKNKEREQAVITQAIQNSTSIATTAATTSQQEAQAVAASAVTTSATFATATNPTQSNTSAVSGMGSGQGIQAPGAKADSGATTLQITQQLSVASALSNSSNASQEARPVAAYTAPVQSISAMATTEVAMPATTGDYLTNRTNPLNEYIDAKPALMMESNKPLLSGPSVNTKVADNELANGVGITRMASAPVGYANYLNLALRDAAFYAPKEVYRNQRNVDNVQVLRQLSSDAKHQQMVEMQYAR